MANLFFRTSIAPYRIDTYNALHERLGCEMHFYWDYDSSQKLNEEGMRKACRFTPQYLKGIKFGGGESRKLCTEVWQILRRNNPEVVIVPEFQPLAMQVLLYRFLFRKKFRVVSMCDDSYDMVANGHDFSRFHTMLRKVLVPLFDDLLLVDSKVCQWYQQHYGKGIWLPIIRDEKKERQNYERALSLSREYASRFALYGKKVLLYVGRFAAVKNLPTLLEAVAKTREQFTTILVGGGEMEETLRCQASAIDKDIIFAGHYVDDGVRAWYNLAQAFILPSTLEPYGAVTNEALIAGDYALISAHAGSSCLISDANGAIISPLDTDAMTEAIDKAMAGLQPLGDDIAVKPSRMPFQFDDVINKVISELKR